MIRKAGEKELQILFNNQQRKDVKSKKTSSKGPIFSGLSTFIGDNKNLESMLKSNPELIAKFISGELQICDENGKPIEIPKDRIKTLPIMDIGITMKLPHSNEIDPGFIIDLPEDNNPNGSIALPDVIKKPSLPEDFEPIFPENPVGGVIGFPVGKLPDDIDIDSILPVEDKPSDVDGEDNASKETQIKAKAEAQARADELRKQMETELKNKNEALRAEARGIAKELKDAIVDEISFSGIKDKIFNNRNNEKTIKALSRITSENVAYVIEEYKKLTGESISDAIDEERGLDINHVKLYLCDALVNKAKSLGIDVSFEEYNSINDMDKLTSWIENLAGRVSSAMSKLSPEQEKKIQDVANSYQVDKKSETGSAENVSKTEPEESSRSISENNMESIKKNSTKLAKDLKDAIFDEISFSGIKDKIFNNRNNEKTLKVLRSITPETVAFVVSEYEKLAGEDIAKSIDNEIGLDITHVKQYICKNLVEQAQLVGLKVSHNDYRNINDLDELSKWIKSVATEVRSKMEVMIKDNDYNYKETTRSNGMTERVVSDRPIFKKAGISKIVEIRDQYGKLLESTTYFKDGKVVSEHYVINKNGNKVKVRKVLRKGSTPEEPILAKPKENITEPVPINIKLPDNASENAKKFAKALEDKKAYIMQTLHIDNDTYNKLARLAMAIAEQETHFGENPGTYRQSKYKVGQVINDTIPDTSKVGHSFSAGYTQIKFDEHVKDADVKAMFEKLGITDASQLYDAENSAMGTVGLLFTLMTRLRNNQNVQQGVDAARGAIVEENGWEQVDGKAQKTYNTKPWVNEITDEDILCYYWNGKGRHVVNGTMQPDLNEYTRNVQNYLEKYEIEEDAKVRSAAIRNSNIASNMNLSKKPYKNNGALGSIVFMPVMYSRKPVNTKSDIAILEKSLKNNKSIDSKSKQLFLYAVKNGLIAFEYGIDKSEADSLTQKEVDMLLSRVESLKSKIKDVNFEDGINPVEANRLATKYMKLIRQAELDFQKEYLVSNARVYNTSDVPSSSVVMNPIMSNDFDVNRMIRQDKLRRGFVGYNQDKGVNPAHTSKASATLANAAKKIANEMRSGGKCMTGFRRAMLEAGVTAANNKDLVEGTPRATVGWFERHPDMFEEVKFMNIGGGKSREITSADLPKLPAGYIVIFVPEADYASEPGHICITNGNGEAYSDETDNMNWGGYTDESKKSGKGEHGTFRIFRLTNKWSVDPETGKLKFNK